MSGALLSALAGSCQQSQYSWGDGGEVALGRAVSHIHTGAALPAQRPGDKKER